MTPAPRESLTEAAVWANGLAAEALGLAADPKRTRRQLADGLRLIGTKLNARASLFRLAAADAPAEPAPFATARERELAATVARLTAVAEDALAHVRKWSADVGHRLIQDLEEAVATAKLGPDPALAEAAPCTR